jgi:hypothetical protein
VATTKKTPASSSRTQSGQAQPKLSTADQFIDAWNAMDLAEGGTISAASHPVGPSRMLQSLHAVKVAFTASHKVFEVTFAESCFYLSY